MGPAVGPGGTSDTRLTGLEQAPDEGHGFSRATGLALMWALKPLRYTFSTVSRELSRSLGPEGRPAKRQPSPEGLGING